jgi:hypothetical protein
MLPASVASAAPTRPAAPAPSDVVEYVPTTTTFEGKTLSEHQRPASRAKSPSLTAEETPPVGTVRQWLALNGNTGAISRKDFVLRGVGSKIEVWVAVNTAFPAGDCRNINPADTSVTDAQVAGLVTAFDTNMFPKETAAFSTPPDHDGTNDLVGPDRNGNGGVFTGAGDKTVALVDNIVDTNYFDLNGSPSYIAGFFSTSLNVLTDRNVMTIDVFDWTHRTGPNPPNNPTDDLCTSRPARPNTYEGVFAHEWQHLLHSYTDPFEGLFMNEGLSDFAGKLTGFFNPLPAVTEPGADSHIYCFQGFGTVQGVSNPNPRDCGGPQNSLNLWNEGVNSVGLLADYGNAFSLMLYLNDHYGLSFMSGLHNDGALQGLASLDAALESRGVHDVYRVLHDFQTSTLVDKIVEGNKGIFLGRPKGAVTSASLRSTVNLANPQSFNTPGAAPNGADYVLLQKNGQPIKGRDLRSLSFKGATTRPSLPLLWTSVTDDPDAAGNAVLWSGDVPNIDSSAVIPVTVPTADPTLRFNAKYGAEFGFDYGYVQVSTDGGATYTSIAGDKTVDAPLGPGLNGTTTGFEPHTFDLSAFAGKQVLLAFRYVADGGVNEGGLKIDDVTLGGTAISDGSNIAAFKSPTQIKPITVNNFNIRIVGIDEAHHFAWQFEFDHKFNLTLNRGQLAILSAFPKVVVLVSYDDPTEQVQQYAPYTLTVNDVLQPGGQSF